MGLIRLWAYPFDLYAVLAPFALTASHFFGRRPKKVTKKGFGSTSGPCAALRGSLASVLLPGGPRCTAHPGPQRLPAIHGRHLPPQDLRSAS